MHFFEFDLKFDESDPDSFSVEAKLSKEALEFVSEYFDDIAKFYKVPRSEVYERLAEECVEAARYQKDILLDHISKLRSRLDD